MAMATAVRTVWLHFPKHETLPRHALVLLNQLRHDHGMADEIAAETDTTTMAVVVMSHNVTVEVQRELILYAAIHAGPRNHAGGLVLLGACAD